jgi:hypothetical protein
MKILKHPFFIGSVLVASFIFVAKQLQIQLPYWLYFYLNDFLCMPIVLSICLLILRIFKKTESLYVPFFVVLGLSTYFSWHFEWLMPQLSTRYTGDFTDIVLYFFGAMLFYIFQKRLF